MADPTSTPPRNWRALQAAALGLAALGLLGALRSGALVLEASSRAAERDAAKAALVRSLSQEARRRVLDSDPLRALPFLEAASRAGAHGPGFDLLLAQAEEALYRQQGLFGGHSRPVAAAQRAPDGRVATAGLDGHLRVMGPDGKLRFDVAAPGLADVRWLSDALLVTASADGHLRLLDGQTGQARGDADLGAPLDSLAVSPGGDLVAVSSDRANLWIRSAHDLAPIATLSAFDEPTPVPDGGAAEGGADGGASARQASVLRAGGWSTDGRSFAAGADGAVRRWDSTFAPLPTLDAPFDVERVSIAASGRVLAVGAHDVQVWDASGASLFHHHEAATAGLVAALDPAGEHVAVSAGEGPAQVWRVGFGQGAFPLLGSRGVTALAYDATGTALLSGSADGRAQLWDATSGALLASLDGHSGAVTSAAFEPDAQALTASRDGTARTWDVKGGRYPLSLRTDGWGAAVRFSGDSVLTLDSAPALRRWSAATGQPLDRFQLAGAPSPAFPGALAASPDGKLAAVGVSGDVALFGLDSHRVERTLAGHQGPLAAADFSSDGRALATADADHTVRLWDVASGTQTHALALDADVGLSLAFSPDGQLLAVGQRLARISLWTPSGERKAELVGPHTSEVAAVAFSRDGKRLASGDADGHVVLWDVAGRQVSQVLEGHTGRVVSVEFSADGGLLLSAGDDGTARLWALDEGQEVARFVAPGPLHSARFSPDGARVATAGADGLTRLWTRPALVHPAAEIFERARCRVPVHLDRERLVAGSGCEAPK